MPSIPFVAAASLVLCIVTLCFVMPGLITPAEAQARKATAAETTAIRDCAEKHKDNLDDIEQRCLFNLVATPCIDKLQSAATNVATANCYETETAIWNDLLNDNYKSLLATLDDGQTGKARAMQRAWITYRDTTCQFYDDKIQGTMSIPMHAACTTRETARRAVLLNFFQRL